jgi:hypothetical protein
VMIGLSRTRELDRPRVEGSHDMRDRF